MYSGYHTYPCVTFSLHHCFLLLCVCYFIVSLLHRLPLFVACFGLLWGGEKWRWLFCEHFACLYHFSSLHISSGGWGVGVGVGVGGCVVCVWAEPTGSAPMASRCASSASGSWKMRDLLTSRVQSPLHFPLMPRKIFGQPCGEHLFLPLSPSRRPSRQATSRTQRRS